MRDKQYSASSGVTQMFSNGGEIDFGIDEAAFGPIIDRLTDVYEVPAIAAVREIFSNAYDATMSEFLSTGEMNEIVITLPSIVNDNYLVIRDFGCGMNFHDVTKVFTRYGVSPKNNDLSSIGAYGLGAKSPLALVNSFHVSTIKDGEKLDFTVVRHPGQIPKIINHTITPTDEHSGTIFSIPMSNASQEERKHAIDTAYMLANFSINFPVRIENDTKDSYGSSYPNSVKSIMNNYSYFYSFNHNNEKYRVFISDDALIHSGYGYISQWFSNRNGNDRFNSYFQVAFLLNGFLYSNNGNEYSGRSSTKYDIIIEIKPGVVDFPSSRDTITSNVRKTEFVNSYLKKQVGKEDYAQLWAQVFSKSFNGSNGFTTDKVFRSFLHGFSNDFFDIPLLLENKDSQDELGRNNHLEPKLISLFEKISEGKTHINAIAYEYDFNSKIMTKFTDDKNDTKDDKKNFPTKSLANDSFASDIDKLHNDNTADVFTSVINLGNNSKYQKVIIIDGYSKTLPSFSRRLGRIDNSFGTDTISDKVLFIFAQKGKITSEDKEILNDLTSVLNVDLVYYSNVDKVPKYKQNRAQLDANVNYCQVSWIGENLEEEITAVETLSTRNVALGFSTKSLFGSYETIIEKVVDENSHLVIIPKINRTAPRLDSPVRFTKIGLILADKYGNDFVEENDIILIENPLALLTKELDKNNVDYSVIGEPERFTRKSLKEKAIKYYQTTIEISTILSTMTDNEIERELFYQLSRKLLAETPGYLASDRFNSILEFVTTHHEHFTKEHVKLAEETRQSLQEVVEKAQRGKHSTRLNTIISAKEITIEEVFKTRYLQVKEKFANIAKALYLQRKANELEEFPNINRVINDSILQEKIGTKQLAPFAEHIMKEITNLEHDYTMTEHTL